jgi:transposase-like protein
VLFSEHRDMATAKAFLRSAKAVTGMTPDRVTTDGHDSYPRAIRSELGRRVRSRTSRDLKNRLEQDHRGSKGRYRPMRDFKCPKSAARFCRGYDEVTTSCAAFSAPTPATTNTSLRLAAGCSTSAAPRLCWPSWKPRSGTSLPARPQSHTCWCEI